MDWIQACTVIGTLGVFTFWLFNKLDSDIKTLSARQEAQVARIDQLYQMFITMLSKDK